MNTETSQTTDSAQKLGVATGSASDVRALASRVIDAVNDGESRPLKIAEMIENHYRPPLDPAIIARRDELKSAHTSEDYAALVTPHRQIITGMISATQKPLADVALALCQQVAEQGGNIVPVLAAYADLWDLQNVAVRDAEDRP